MRGLRWHPHINAAGIIQKGINVLFHPGLLFLTGALAEGYASLLMDTPLGKATPIDEIYSLFAVSMLILSALWYLHRLGNITWELLLAAVCITSSKFLEVIANMYGYTDLPIIGNADMRSKMIHGALFASGTLLMLVGLFRFARRIWIAKNELEWHNRQLRAEREELERVREALEKSERMLQCIIESIPEAVFWKDKQLRYLGCNRRYMQLLGKDRLDEIIGRSDEAFYVLRERLDAYREADQAVIATDQGVYGLVETMRYPNGDFGWIRINKVPLNDTSGRVIGVLGTIEDVTERKQREDEMARLVTALNQADESVIITDPNGIVQYVNPAFERTSGYAGAEIIGKKPPLSYANKGSAEFYAKVWKTIQQGDVWHGHFTSRRKDGASYEEQVTISPVRNEYGAIINYVALKRDVTNERKLERQLSQAQKMEAIGQLAGGIAHDFNNLLQVVSGYAEMALSELPSDAKAGRTLELCRGAIGRAARLVRQLLAFGRRQDGQPESIDANSLISDMLRMINRLIGEHIELQFVPAGKPLWIFADPTQVEQILLNLCVNARDAMPGGGKIEIRAASAMIQEERKDITLTLSPGEYVCITVADTGHGIAEEVIEHIFEPFFSTKEMGQGAGLGLATVYGIVRQYNGGITVQSTIGKGTTFQVYFPSMTQETPSVQREIPVIADEAAGGVETILVAEDEEMVRELAREILLSKGYRVIEACDGLEAIRLYDQYEQEIQLVLTDVVMPQAGGMQVCSHVKEKHPEIPVVFCSGYSRDIWERRMQHVDGNHVVHKPYSRATLLLRVREALDSALYHQAD